jgi:surfeit locus 1 family protein
MARTSLIWPVLLAAAAFAVLVGLGTWQLQRLAWKEGLIARIEARAKAGPVSLPAALAQWRETGEVEYLRVRIEGRFRHAGERHLYALRAGRAGWRIVTPLATGGGAIVLVDRGFVPNELKAPAARREGQVEGEVAIVGLARAPEVRGLFTPDNDAAANSWFWRDLDAMGRSVLGPDERQRLVPFFVEAEAAPVPGGWPQGGVTRLDLPNRHLEYALTWYGLAAALAAVFTVFVLSRRRERP